MCCLNARVITVCACMSDGMCADVCVLRCMCAGTHSTIPILYICICLLSPLFCVLLLQKYAGDSDLMIDLFLRNLSIRGLPTAIYPWILNLFRCLILIPKFVLHRLKIIKEKRPYKAPCNPIGPRWGLLQYRTTLFH